ncbi:MAG: lipoyl synthase, partial [Anaerolineae bacterium]
MECYAHKTATFMVLGDVCTRRCGFCSVAKGKTRRPDPTEPERVASSIRQMGLRHAVITSVNRDELADGGAAIFARCITRSRELSPECSVEVLIPDFKGDHDALDAVMAARPDILNHNIETVPRLYREVRPQAIYGRSLDILRWAKETDPDGLTKTGIMVGLGETRDEITEVMRDLVGIGVDILTVGQYLRPTESHLPVQRYYTPAEFDEIRDEGLALGLRWVESGPLVRSSYRAEQQVAALSRRAAGPDSE